MKKFKKSNKDDLKSVADSLKDMMFVTLNAVKQVQCKFKASAHRKNFIGGDTLPGAL